MSLYTMRLGLDNKIKYQMLTYKVKKLYINVAAIL